MKNVEKIRSNWMGHSIFVMEFTTVFARLFHIFSFDAFNCIATECIDPRSALNILMNEHFNRILGHHQC